LFTSVVSAALTLLRLAVIWLTAPDCTLTLLSWSSEERRAEASVHRDEPDGAAAADDEVAEAGAEGELLDEVLPDPQPASSASPHTAKASLRPAVLVTMGSLMS